MASPPIGLVVPVSASPSLLFGNLSAGGGRVCHVHKDEVWVNSAEALQGGESSGEVKAVAAVDGNGGAAAGQAAAGGGTAGAAPAGDKSPHEVAPQVASARLVQLGAGVDDCFLVTTTASGMTVCSTRTLSRVFSFAIPAEDAAAVGRKAQLCGAAFVLCPDGEGRHLVVGGHNGACYVFEYDGKGFKFASRLEEHSNAIIDISSEAAVRAAAGADALAQCKESPAQMISADQEGRVVAWTCGDAGSYAPLHIFPATGQPCVGARARGDLMVSAYLDGMLKVHNLRSAQLMCEVKAHARWLSAITMHPTSFVVATAAQDSTLAVWKWDEGAERTDGVPKLVLHSRWKGGMMTGACFVADRIAVAAYDRAELHLYPLPDSCHSE